VRADAETTGMKRAGPELDEVNTLKKRSKSMEQQRHSGLRLAVYAAMDARRDTMGEAEAAALVQRWIKAIWLSKLTNFHGLRQTTVL
jgi:hypothetical protein